MKLKPEDIFVWFVKLVPVAALFSLFFALDGNLKWLGALAIIPLVMAFRKDCPSCALRHDEDPMGGWRPWAGH